MDDAISLMDAEIKRFLLGEMAEVERLAFEERLVLEEDLSTEVATAERDLLDALARGELASAAAAQLEAGLLRSPVGRSHLEVAQAMAAWEESRAWKESSAWEANPAHRFSDAQRWVLAAVLSAVVLGSWWWFTIPPTSVDPLDGTAVATISMTSPRANEATLPQVEVPTTAVTFRLQIALEGVPYDGPYTVRLRHAEGSEVFHAVGLSPAVRGSEEVLPVEIPAARLTAGEYSLALFPAARDIPLVARFRLVR